MRPPYPTGSTEIAATQTQWFSKSRNPVQRASVYPGKWHGRERAYITVNDRRIPYDTRARGSQRDIV